jgi:hypothetical protein
LEPAGEKAPIPFFATASLLGRSAEDLQNLLTISDEESERIARLLQRSGSLAIEMERLASLGIFALTRAMQITRRVIASVSKSLRHPFFSIQVKKLY